MHFLLFFKTGVTLSKIINMAKKMHYFKLCDEHNEQQMLIITIVDIYRCS